MAPAADLVKPPRISRGGARAETFSASHVCVARLPIMTNTSDLPDIRQQLGDRYAIERELRERFLRETRTAASFSHPTDFGISRSITAKVDRSAPQGLTRVREVVGTAEYISPEQAVIIALLQLPIAILLIKASLNVRLSLGTKAEVVQTESREPTGGSLGRLTMAASGLSLLGVSFLLLARSPFRMPPGERLFRVVWLGARGRAFVRFSSRNVTPLSSGKTALGLAGTRANVNIAEAGRAAAPVVAMTATPTDRMRSLEDRVAALERWRDGAKT